MENSSFTQSSRADAPSEQRCRRGADGTAGHSSGKSRKQVVIYTDGGAKPNPGRGGYGVVLLYCGRRKELSGGYRRTTNNRMEILAAIRALEALTEPCCVTLHTDSQYLAKAMSQGWAARWRRNGWMRNKKDAAKNPDLWGRLLDLCDGHQVTFKWVRGHADSKENNRCDDLASQARQRADLPADDGFESQPQLL